MKRYVGDLGSAESGSGRMAAVPNAVERMGSRGWEVKGGGGERPIG